MRRIMISADIEGCAGVASQNALAPERWEWQAARGWMTNEVVAAAQAALDAGYGEVIVADGHGNAHNILPDAMPEGVRLIRSWPRPLLQMEGIQTEGVEACFFIGYHNGSTQEGGALAHSYHGGAIRDIRLNDVSCSEGYLNAALAGEYGVPVVLVSGDGPTMIDADRYAPDAQKIVVKDAIGFRAAGGFSPQSACRLIAEGATRALTGARPAALRVPGPYVAEFEMTSRVTAEMLAYLPGVALIGAFTARVELPKIADVMRFTSFAIMYSPTGAIAL